MAQENILSISLKEYRKEIEALKGSLLSLDKESEEYAKTVEEINNRQRKLDEVMKVTSGATSAATNSMASMKEQLKEWKKEANTLDVGSKRFKDLSEKILETTNKLKELEEAQGTFSRNVGNYKSVREELKELELQMVSMLQEGVNPNDEAFRSLAERAGNLKDAMADAKSIVNQFADDNMALTSVLDVTKTLTASYGVLQGGMSIFGVESSKLHDRMVKLQAIMTTVNSLSQLQSGLMDKSTASGRLFNKLLETLNITKKKNVAVTQESIVTEEREITTDGTVTTSKTAVAGATTLATTALKAFKAALVSTGIGALIIALGEVVSLFIDWVSTGDDATETTNKLSQAQENATKTTDDLYNYLMKLAELQVAQGLINETEKLTKGLDNAVRKTDELRSITETAYNNYRKALNDAQLEQDELNNIVENGQEGLDKYSWNAKILYDIVKNSNGDYEKLIANLLDADDSYKILSQGINELSANLNNLEGNEKNVALSMLNMLTAVQKLTTEAQNAALASANLANSLQSINDKAASLEIQAMADGYKKVVAQADAAYNATMKGIDVTTKEGKRLKAAAEAVRQKTIADYNAQQALKRKQEAQAAAQRAQAAADRAEQEHTRKLKEAAAAISDYISRLNFQLSKESDRLKYLQDLNKAQGKYNNAQDDTIARNNLQIEQNNKIIESIKEQIATKELEAKDREKFEQQISQIQYENQKLRWDNEVQAAQKSYDLLRKTNQQKIDEMQKSLGIMENIVGHDKQGEGVSQIALNTYIDALLDLTPEAQQAMMKFYGLDDETQALIQEKLELANEKPVAFYTQMEEQEHAHQEAMIAEQQRYLDELMTLYGPEDNMVLQFQQQINNMKEAEEERHVMTMIGISQKLSEREKIDAKGRLKIAKADVKEQVKVYSELATSMGSLMGGIADIMKQNLDQKVKNGEISEEEAKKEFERIKKMQVAEAIVNTLSGAVGAYMQATSTYAPPFGPILGGINAAAATAMGIAQITQIKAQQYGSNSTPSTPAASEATNVSQSVDLNNVSVQPLLDENRDIAATGTYYSGDQRVYILQSDIIESDRQVEIRQNESTF